MKSQASGIDCQGNFNIQNSSLNTKDFNEGLFLSGELDQKIDFLGNSNVSFIGNGYGINSTKGNKELNFAQGNIYIEGNTGINYCNVTVNEAILKVVANNGYVIERHEGLKQVFTTKSGQYTKGEVYLINKTPYNQWWDVNYTLCVDELNVNGGTLHLEGNSVNGVIYTVKGSKFNLANCDMFIVNNSFGHGINAGSFNEELTIAKTARLFVEHCDIAIGCWLTSSEIDSVIKVYIYGDFAVNNYKARVGEWDTHCDVIEGSIRYGTQVV